MSEECSELLPRRYWVDVGFQRARKRHELQQVGFKRQPSGHNVYKTKRLEKALQAVEIAKSIVGGNNGHSVQIRVSTQPLCLDCNALLKFSSERCCDCGSFNIERTGWLNLSTKRIEFEKRGTITNFTKSFQEKVLVKNNFQEKRRKE